MQAKPKVIKKNSFWQKLQRIRDILHPKLIIEPLDTNIEIWRNVRVKVRDGTELSINIYKPKNQTNPLPTLLCLHPYNKDNLPKKIPLQYRFIRQTSTIRISEETSWEAPDPNFWVRNGYIIGNIDKRGFGKSDGQQGILNEQEAQDYYDIIEWVANQSWSNQKVGLFGVSYLAISQYKVAALNPPHLRAICPWEGFTDPYKDAFYPGGIREDGFILMWSRGVKQKSETNIRGEQVKHYLHDTFYQEMIPDLTKINVPALICASFSDHQLHTRGSFRAFGNISSPQKWLYTHRDGKWATFYSAEAKACQLKFFDRFLKGIDNDMEKIPSIRLEVRESRDIIYKVYHADSWPLSHTKWQPLFLDTNNAWLTHSEPIHKNNQVSFQTNSQSIQFSYFFTRNTQIIGPMKLTLFIQLNEIDDMNLFVALQKFHKQKEISFEGSYGFANDVVTKGFMRVALRKLNPKKSLYHMPEHDFNEENKLQPGEIAKLEISLLPSATIFNTNDELRLLIQGVPILKAGKLDQIGAYQPSKAGICTVLSNNIYPSSLLIPFVI